MKSALLDALCGAFDQLTAGFVAALADGKVLFANASAREMTECGWPIRIQDGYLLGEGRKTTELLLKGLRQAAGSPHRQSYLDICLCDGERGAAVATMKPLANPALAGCGSIVAVAVTRIEALDCCGGFTGVAHCYGLTPTEVKTLQHVLAGGLVAGAPEAFSISRNTMKSHLQSIFAKTGSARQPHLFKLINGLRPPLRPVAPSGAAAIDAP